ncbi:MAG: hypothetical protein ACJAZN_002231 [Planctomycetota bacterium]|jgi:hypothetical protein
MKQTMAAAVRTTAALALLGAFFTGSIASANAGATLPAAQSALQVDGAVYMRTKASAVARNFPDQNGSALATIAPGTIVRAFRSSSGTPVFREVEIGGGFPVWVYGTYLQRTDVEDVLMVTGSRVNMRPLPALSASAMALRSKLNSGERVLMLARANKSGLFSEDWIRIQAPASAKAWITADSLEPIDRVLGKLEWREVNAPLPTTPRARSGAGVTNASLARSGQSTASGRARPSVVPVTSETLSALADADRMFEAADALKTASSTAWEDVVAAYVVVVDEAPGSSITHGNATTKLTDARLKLELAVIRDELVAKRTRHDEDVRQIDAYLADQKRKRTARWDRYSERGWLESRNVGGQKRWYLVFAGQTVAEVRCMSERYQMDVFDGFEIGVIGREVIPVVQATQTSLAEARVVDIQRIEVISAKGRL